jgi:hypothetical protein
MLSKEECLAKTQALVEAIRGGTFEYDHGSSKIYPEWTMDETQAVGAVLDYVESWLGS